MQGVLRSLVALSLLATGCHLVFPHRAATGDGALADRPRPWLDASALDGVPPDGLAPWDGGPPAVDAAGPLPDAPPPGAFCKGQAAPYLYCSDFDSSLAGWVADGANGAGFVNATPATWGGTNDEYWSADPGDGDRSLAFYKSSNTSLARWKLTLTNTSGQLLSALSVSYSLEVPWVRFQGADQSGAEYGYRQAAVSIWLDTGKGLENLATSSTLDNKLVPAADRARWLSRAERALLGLRIAKLTTTLYRPIPAGASFTFAIGRDGYAPGEEQNMNVGIDELVLRGVP